MLPGENSETVVLPSCSKLGPARTWLASVAIVGGLAAPSVANATIGSNDFLKPRRAPQRWLPSSIDWLPSGGSRVCRSGRTFRLADLRAPRLTPRARGSFLPRPHPPCVPRHLLSGASPRCGRTPIAMAAALPAVSPACWRNRRSATIEPSKPPGRPTHILGVVGCPSALEWEVPGQGPLPGSRKVCGPPISPHLTTPADIRLAPRASSVRWDFLACLSGLLNSKEMLHMFKKCVSIWDAQGAGTKQQRPALKRKGPQARFTDIFGRQASL